MLSFDSLASLGGVAVDRADLVTFDDPGFTLLFDASIAGIPRGLNLDAAHYLDLNGHLLLSFDTTGTVGGVTFSDEDVVEYDPVAGTWELVYDGSLRQANWPPADMDALYVTPTALVCPADLVLANQTLTGTQTLEATATATLGPNLIVNGTNIVVNAPIVPMLSGTEIGGTFTVGSNPSCP